MKERKISLYDVLVLGLIAGLTLLYISLIFNRDIWTDEAFTVRLVNPKSVRDIIVKTADDVHPPLYYLIAYVFVSIFGTGLKVYKAVSIVPMVLTMLLGLLYVKPKFGEKAAVIYILFVNAIPCVMEYCVQVRMYTWCMLFVTVTAICAYEYFLQQNTKQLILLTVTALCTCYIHNYAMISTFFMYGILGILLLVQNRKFPVKWLISGLTVALGFLPWLFVLLNQTTNRIDNYWIEELDWETIVGYLSDLFGSRIPYTTLMFVIIIIMSFVLFIARIREEKNAGVFGIVLLIVPLLTAVFGITISVLVTPFFVARYLVSCFGLVSLAVAIALGKENNYTYVLLCIFLIGMIGNSYYENFKAEYRTTHTEELYAYLDEHMGENDMIIYNYQVFDFIYECYFDPEKLAFLGDFDFSQQYDNIWFLDSCCSPWLDDSILPNYGLAKEYINTFGIEHNDFRVYRIYRQ